MSSTTAGSGLCKTTGCGRPALLAITSESPGAAEAEAGRYCGDHGALIVRDLEEQKVKFEVVPLA